MGILSTTKPNLFMKHSPKILFKELLCFIESIISLLFGFSIIMLSDLCLLVIKQVNQTSNYLTNNLFLSKKNIFTKNKNPYHLNIIRRHNRKY